MGNKFCQSCGMPMTADEQFGRNVDGSRNEEYCSYCYRDGVFTEDCTMNEMIDHCLQFLRTNSIKTWSILTRKKRLVPRCNNSFQC